MNGVTSSVVAGATVTTALAGFEAATGICIPLFIWGAVGGLWAFWYIDPMSLRQRLASLAIAALVASVGAKPFAMVLIGFASHALSWWPKAVDAQLVAVPIAITIGLLCHTVIGKKLIEIANRGADGVLK